MNVLHIFIVKMFFCQANPLGYRLSFRLLCSQWSREPSVAGMPKTHPPTTEDQRARELRDPQPHIPGGQWQGHMLKAMFCRFQAKVLSGDTIFQTLLFILVKLDIFVICILSLKPEPIRKSGRVLLASHNCLIKSSPVKRWIRTHLYNETPCSKNELVLYVMIPYLL